LRQGILFPVYVFEKLTPTYYTQVNNEKEKIHFFHSGGLIMPKCRSPPFFVQNHIKTQTKRNGGNYMPKEYFLYVNGQKVKVSEQIYKVYWQEREHEKYLEQVDKKNHLLFFSSIDHDGHFVENIVDERVDIEKLVETQMMIEALRDAMAKLNDEERDIIERIYFNEESIRSVAKSKSISHPALVKKREKIFKKIKKIIEKTKK